LDFRKNRTSSGCVRENTRRRQRVEGCGRGGCCAYYVTELESRLVRFGSFCRRSGRGVVVLVERRVGWRQAQGVVIHPGLKTRFLLCQRDLGEWQLSITVIACWRAYQWRVRREGSSGVNCEGMRVLCPGNDTRPSIFFTV